MRRFIYKIYEQILFRKKGFTQSPLQLKKFLLKSQYWNLNQIQVFQLNAFNELIEDAKKNTIYYKKKFNDQLLPVKDLNMIANYFPRLTKEEIIKNSNFMINSKVSPRFKHSTSGSTGKPMIIEISNLAEADRMARLMRFLSWWDVDIGDRNVLLWGVNKSENVSWQRIKNWLRNRITINALELSDDTILHHFNLIERFQPFYIRGYTSSILQLAKLMEKRELKFQKSKLKVIIVTAVMLFERDRIYMEQIFDCRIANEYGAAELGIIANECPRGSMHINEESIYIDTYNRNNVIATELKNICMPLINYENEDKLKILNKKCGCGRQSRIIDKIEGRYSDFIKCTDGSEKNQYLFYAIMKEIDDIGYKGSIKHYKISQDNFNFVVELVANSNYNESISSYIKDRMYDEIGKDISIDIQLVSEIKRDKSGKSRFFANLSQD